MIQVLIEKCHFLTQNGSFITFKKQSFSGDRFWKTVQKSLFLKKSFQNLAFLPEKKGRFFFKPRLVGFFGGKRVPFFDACTKTGPFTRDPLFWTPLFGPFSPKISRKKPFFSKIRLKSSKKPPFLAPFCYILKSAIFVQFWPKNRHF